MPPVVSIVGRSGSGKTTLLEKLVSELTARGYRVATVKHTPHRVDLNPEKDTARYLEAGSRASLASSHDKIVLIKPVDEEAGLADLVRLLGEDYDLILTEGFKQEDAPKVEVHRREVGAPLDGLKKLLAIVTDEPLEAKIRQFSLSDIKGLADFLESGFIRPQEERLAIYVNGTPLSLSSFPRELVTSVLLGMVSSLKGGSEIERLDISLRRRASKTREESRGGDLSHSE
jgi:molybdopterin-guanine dinucleotide biosynthesis adapter protein